MKLRTYKKNDLKEISSLIYSTYQAFNKKEGTKKAIERYLSKYDFDQNEEFLNRMFSGSDITFVAIEGTKIIGVIRADIDRVYNLFVDASFQGKGVGKKLLQAYEHKVKKKGGKKIQVRASLYAVPFYQKNGYRKTTGVRSVNGLKFQPMKKVIVAESL